MRTDLPNREAVTTIWSEAEAFDRATRLYESLITARTPSASAPIVAEAEAAFFRPACELQLAGLCLLGGRDVPKPQAVVFALACFAVDHLLWGWMAAVNAQPRVALTLSRAAVEASIFSLAAAENYDAFERDWLRKPRATQVLKSITNLPPNVRTHFEKLWKLVVPFAHASVASVMRPCGTFLDGNEKHVGISFAGQYAGPMDASILGALADVYAFGAIGGAQAMRITLLPTFTDKTRWETLYEQLTMSCETPRPVPRHLRPYVGERARKGNGPP